MVIAAMSLFIGLFGFQATVVHASDYNYPKITQISISEDNDTLEVTTSFPMEDAVLYRDLENVFFGKMKPISPYTTSLQFPGQREEMNLYYYGTHGTYKYRFAICPQEKMNKADSLTDLSTCGPSYDKTIYYIPEAKQQTSGAADPIFDSPRIPYPTVTSNPIYTLTTSVDIIPQKSFMLSSIRPRVKSCQGECLLYAKIDSIHGHRADAVHKLPHVKDTFNAVFDTPYELHKGVRYSINMRFDGSTIEYEEGDVRRGPIESGDFTIEYYVVPTYNNQMTATDQVAFELLGHPMPCDPNSLHSPGCGNLEQTASISSSSSSSKSVKTSVKHVTTTPTSQGSFTDIAQNEFKDSIEYLKKNTIVGGYPDGSYKPNLMINRAEFTKIVIGALYPKSRIDKCASNYFSDTEANAWYTSYLCTAKDEQIIGGYPDGTFRAAEPINFSEAAKILANSFGLTSQEGLSPWYKGYVEALATERAIPKSIRSFDHNLSRGEMAEFMYRLHSKDRSQSSKFYHSF